MLKKSITYTDYNDHQRTEDFYFNLSKSELIELELSTSGGLTVMMDRIIAAEDTPALFKIFKDLVLKAYGVKSDDGRKFIKNQEVRDDFSQTEAFSVLIMELVSDAEKAAEFFNAIIPQDFDGIK